MKKIKVALAAFVLAGLTLTSCGSDDNGGGTPAEITGKWNPTKTVTKIGTTTDTQDYVNNTTTCDKDYFEFVGTTGGNLRDVIFVSGQNGCSEDLGDPATWTKADKALTIVGGDLEGSYEITTLSGSDLVISDKFTQAGQEVSITYHFRKAAN